MASVRLRARQRPRAATKPITMPAGTNLVPSQGRKPSSAKQRNASRAARALVQPQGQQRGAGQRGAGGQLRVDRGAVGQEGRAEAHHGRGADRPRVGHHPERQPVGQRHRQRGDGRQEQLDALRAAHDVGGEDEQREAHAVRLVQAAVGLHSVLVEGVGVELGVGARGELVVHVHVVVALERFGRQQVVRLVAGVVGLVEGVEAESGGVDAEEHEEEGRGSLHCRRKARLRT